MLWICLLYQACLHQFRIYAGLIRSITKKTFNITVMHPKKHTCKNSGVVLCNLCIVCVISYEYEKYRNGVFSTLSTIEMYSLFCDICNTELTLWILQFRYIVFKTQFLPHKSYCTNVRKTTQSTLLGETTVVYSENHIKYMTHSVSRWYT